MARNGTVSPKYVLYQPRLTTVLRLVRKVTSSGTIMVARKTTNSVLLNGKWRKAKA